MYANPNRQFVLFFKGLELQLCDIWTHIHQSYQSSIFHIRMFSSIYHICILHSLCSIFSICVGKRLWQTVQVSSWDGAITTIPSAIVQVQASYTFKIPGYLPENKFAAGRSPVEWAAVIVVVAGRYCVEEEEAVVVVAVVTGRSCSAKEAAVVAGRFGTQEEIVAGRCGGGATIEARALLWHWPKPVTSIKQMTIYCPPSS